MICPNIESPKWKDLVNKIGENNAYIEFLKHRDIPDASHYDDNGVNIFRSIKTKTTEEIAEGLDLSLTRNQIEIKYTKFIQANLLNTLGDISPNKQLEISPSKAFASVKELYKDVADSLNLALNVFVKSDADLTAIKASAEFEEIAKEMPLLRYVNSHNEIVNALTTYDNLIKDFDKYRDYVVADLAGKGIKITDNKIENINPEDKEDKEQDETENLDLGNNEINKEKFDKSIFETNPRDTASLRVKALIQTIKTGEFEFGIPIYADADDVFVDILYAGSSINLTGFTDTDTKFLAFKTVLTLRKESRPYLNDLLLKLNTFEKDGQWDKINDILTFATKAFANETLVLYKTQKNGEELLGIKEVKVINSNRDTIEEQVSRDWFNKHTDSSFFIKDSLGNLKPNSEKLEKLKNIIDEGQEAKGFDKVKKFQEFFSILGIELTDKELEYIAPKLANTIKKGTRFEGLFKANNMLQNIYNEYEANKDVVFEGQYGLNNQKSSMNKLANLYFDANPGMYHVTSSKSADGKNKYLYIPPTYSENKKREFENGNTNDLDNSPLAAPNKEDFWNNVKNKVKTFALGYFNGLREQENGKKGKVRKALTSKEQHATMLLKHQADVNSGTYVSFTLSDKTTSIETKISKEFFVDEESATMGKGIDFSVEKGIVKFTDSLKDKVYNTFVEPEVSRMIVALKNMDSISLENFKISSRLFYIIPSINTDPRLAEFRSAINANASLEDLKKYSTLIGEVVLDDVYKSAQIQFKEYIGNNTITEKTAKNGDKFYTYPLFYTKYVNKFKQTGVTGKKLGMLMLIDMKLNYMNAQVKTVQFLRFDPMLAFKAKVGNKEFENLTDAEKLGYIKSTWDEFSKRAAALIAPGSQGNWNWKYNGNKEYNSNKYNAVTVSDVIKVIGNTSNETTDAQEFVTMQEHTDHLFSEGKLPQSVWENIHSKIVKAKPGGYYELTSEELKYIFTPVKPVVVNDVNEAGGLNRIDYVKSSRFPLIPQHEIGSDRDKIRIWMEKNNVQSLNFASGKKLGRPGSALSLFNEKGDFVEPTKEAFDGNVQVLNRDGLRTQQEMPHQKSHIATVTQMNRTLFDGLLEDKFDIGGLKNISGRQAKGLKELVRSRLFENANTELQRRLGNVSKTHEGVYELLKDIILNDTTGSYTDNDLRSIELDPATKKFKMGLEFQFKSKKMQGLINSLVNSNVMLKVDGASFVQVSGVGAKYRLSELSNGVKSDIIWIDKHVQGKKEISLDYIRKTDTGVSPAQVLVSQYIRDEKGNLIDLAQFVTEKDGVKILDTSKFSPELLQLVASRIPNQSHPSTLPIEVVGFLPSYMENSIVVPDGITGQMGSDFDVDKLFAYLSKVVISRNEKGDITGVDKVKYNLNDVSDVNNLSQEQLEQLYRDIHWAVLTNPATFDKITGSVDMPELKNILEDRKKQLAKYEITEDDGPNLPLDYGTSIKKFNDNKSGKDGVAIFASNISAQADFQDKTLRLGYMEDGEEKSDPVYIRLKKGGDILDLLNIGQTATSISKVEGKNVKRSISDNLNMMFTESVDNAKNQLLRLFNWDKKAMGPIGALAMLSTNKKQSVNISFATGLTSQASVYDLFEKVDNKQDSFGKFDVEAMANSILELQADLAKKIDDLELLKDDKKGFEHLTNAKRDTVLDPDTLAEMWVVGKALNDTEIKASSFYEEAIAKGEDLSGINDPTLVKIAKDYGYANTKDLLLAYYSVQHDVLSLFYRLDSISREMSTIFGSVYPYTQGIGPTVFDVKQKLNQLNKLSASTTFLGIEDVAGKIKKSPQGVISIDPIGEIGSAISNSYIVAQTLYHSLFPISTGAQLEGIVNKLLQNQGISGKDEIGKDSYISLHTNVFEGIKAFLYTAEDLELFSDPFAERAKLINGDTSIGKRIQNFKETSTDLAKNGFLKNIEVKPQYKGDAYTISFKAPFGTDIDEKAVITGFYELATSNDSNVRELARDLAAYPFLTGDAGNIGRFIPVNYYMSDSDFKNAIGSLNETYITSVVANDSTVNQLIDQIVQNNPEEYAKAVKFTTFNGVSGKKDNVFKKILKPLVGNAENLSEVKTFTITVGDIKKVDGHKGIEKSFRVKASTEELNATPKEIKTDGFKYSPYILITDAYSDDTALDQNRTRNYLYKRVSEAIPVNGRATYERINILGYNGISEYDISNPNLVSSIKDNNVPEDFNTDISEVIPEPFQPKVEELTLSNENAPKGELVKEGIYVNQAVLNKEEQLELFNYLKPFLEEQAAKTNKGASASKMIGLGLRWDYKSNNSGKEEMDIPDVIEPRNKNKYGYYDTSINNLPLGEITPRFKELMEKAIGIDMTHYDGAIINLYDNTSFISSHNDVDESKSAIKYPVIGINLGGTGNFSIESRDGNPKQLNLKAGTAYIFGVDGKNRSVFHRTFAGKQDSFLPELTTKLDGKTYEPGSYRVTITMRRVMPLEPGMPVAPSIKKETEVLKQNLNVVPIEQNFKDGQGGRKMQPQFAGKSTMDLILSGDRTRTTRANTDIARMIKDYNLSKIEDLVGKIIPMSDKQGRTANTKITKITPFTQEYQDKTWQKEGWDKATTDKHVGDYPYAIEFELVKEIDSVSASEYTNHSGGAALSDAEWDQIGREFGVVNHKHYREPLEYIDTKGQPAKGSKTVDSKKLQAAGIEPTYINQKDYDEGAKKATQAFRMMFTDAGNKSVRSAYIIRNWMQVKNADAVYALGTIKQPGENASDKAGETRIAAVPIVKGGTGYAVQMAINESKPVYVFDGTKEGWYTYDYKVKNFVPTETPTLTKNFAGIGSRSLSTQEVIDKSLQAIRDVYEKTFNSKLKDQKSGNILLNNVGDEVKLVYQAQYKQANLTYTINNIEETSNGYIVTLKGQGYNGATKETITIENGKVVSSIRRYGGKDLSMDLSKANYDFKFAEQLTQSTGIKTYTGKIESLEPNQVFVFGSNPLGINGNPEKYPGMSASVATKNSWVEQGEKMDNRLSDAGKAWGLTTVTGPGKQKSMSPEQIQVGIAKLYGHAKANPSKEFLVAYSAGARNNNGYTPQEMADMFSSAEIPANMVFEEGFSKLLNKKKAPITQQSTEEEIIPEKPSTVVEYGSKNTKYIIEGTEEDNDVKVYATNAEGIKGAEILDSNLINKITLTDLVNKNPENVVTLEFLKGSPKYYISSKSEVISLQDTSYGNQINSSDVYNRVMTEFAKKQEVQGLDPEPDFEAPRNILEGGKTIKVPEGSKSTNNIIFEDANNVYLMNDGQQKAYDFIKGQVENLLKTRQKLDVNSLDSTVSFTDPLTKKFNGVIPTEMWNNMIGLAGRGGVGKTTVIKAIVDSIDTGSKYSRPFVMYLTPSHTAATVLQESLGLDSEKANDGKVNTIAAATRRNKTVVGSSDLAMMDEYDYLKTVKFKPAFGAPDILIIDESSMVSQQNIKDMITRIKTDLAKGNINKMPIFIFMGDYRQLGPIKEEQNKFVNKGIISSTLLLDKSKTKELNQVMRSGNKLLHKIYDSIGEGIIDNIDRTKNGLTPEKLSFDEYDKLTKESSENILIVNNAAGVIDDYADYLSKNNNPYGMFWVHYNQVDNAKTKNLASAIRQAYFNKAGLKLDAGTTYRNFTIGDYIEYTAGLETATNDIKNFNTSNPEIVKLIDSQKDISKNNNGSYNIGGGVIKPRARMKVLDIQITKQPLSNYLPMILQRVIINPDREISVEQMLIYNRQDRIRAINKVLGLTVEMGTYNPISKSQENIVIKDKNSGDQLAKFNLNYGEFKKVEDALRTINEGGSMPFTPSYIGSSHTAQGNSIKNVIVGDYNIREALANGVTNQDDVFSSMYVGLTRTSGTLTIIKPAGMTIVNNQDVYKGALTDKNERLPITNGETDPSIVAALNAPTVNPANEEVIDLVEFFGRAQANTNAELLSKAIFGEELTTNNFKSVLNEIFKSSNDPFVKELLKVIGSSSAMTAVTFKIDTTLTDPGQYNPNTKVISINPKLAIGTDLTDLNDARAKMHEVIIHELVHHITVDMLKANPETLNTEQRKFVMAFKLLFKTVQDKFLADPEHSEKLRNAIEQSVKENGFLSAADKSLYYGLTNIYDFASMLLSDKDFQNFMNNTEFSGSKSILDRFMEMLSNLFKALGLNIKEDSVLKEGITNIVGMVKAAPAEGEVLKSIATKSAKQILIEENFNDIIKSLGIKTEC